MSRRLPALSFRDVIRALERLGFEIHHVTGSHYRLKHRQDPSRSTVVRVYPVTHVAGLDPPRPSPP